MKIDIKADEHGDLIIINLEPVAYCVGGTAIVVPPGFQSNGFSAPRWLWPILSPQVDPRTLHTAIAHDHMYQYHTCTRREADYFLLYDLIRHDFPLILSAVSWCGVRAWGWSHW